MSLDNVLKEYVVAYIIPQYLAFDKGHNIDHVKDVIENSLVIAEDFDVDIDMVFTVAAYHDVGIKFGREKHNITSAKILADDKFIAELNIDLKKKKITISLSPKAVEFIAKESYSPEMGARPIKRYIQNNITEQLSDEILFGKLKGGGSVDVSFKKKLILKFKELN